MYFESEMKRTEMTEEETWSGDDMGTVAVATDPGHVASDTAPHINTTSRPPSGPRPPHRSLRKSLKAATQRKHWAVILLISAYVGWFSYLSWKLYYGYGYPAFDLAIFDQGMWLLTHFHIPFVTVMGRNLFGDHTSFILLLFAPFYRLFPEPMGLLVLQTLALAGAAIPIYVLGQKFTRNTYIATGLAAAFLLNPALEQGNLQQFHPEALQVLIIAFAIYAAIESRPRLLFVMVVLSLMVKEDAALLVVPLGLWVLWRRDRKWGLWVIAGAVAWTAAVLEWIIPTLLGQGSLYSGDLPFGGVTGFFKTLFTLPVTMFTYLVDDNRPYYVWQIGFTTGWSFLLSPEIAAIGLLVLIENVISTLPYMHQLPYQFSMPLVPVLVLGTVWAVARQKSTFTRYALTTVTVGCALWSCVLWGYAPFSSNSVTPTWSPNSAAVRAFATLDDKIPPNAIVSAWYLFVPHLDHRTQIYLWPTPFDTQNYGLFNNNGTVLPIASKVQYLVLQIPVNTSEDLNIFQPLAKQFKLIAHDDGIGLFKRTSP
jgi:uncharacterized membrane protein